MKSGTGSKKRENAHAIVDYIRLYFDTHDNKTCGARLAYVSHTFKNCLLLLKLYYI